MASFTWDPQKSRSNRRKHGVTFESASGVFSDPLALSMPDSDPSYGEERWITMGQVNGSIFVVAHTEEDKNGNIRIISARKATKHEQRWYQEG
jgi:uncharacterized DUF497 family protein